MKRDRRVKIVATLGPASQTPDIIQKLFEAGCDVFRINMSHTSHEGLMSYVGMIRTIEKECNHPLGILVDLQGPKLRISTFKEGSTLLKNGDTFTLWRDPIEGDSTGVCLPHEEVFHALEPGHRILLDDGRIHLKVKQLHRKGSQVDRVETDVIAGGLLSNRKGTTFPDSLIPVSALTPKDQADLDAALALNVDWIALSFVQRPEDVEEVRRQIQGRAFVMAKIEKPQALACINTILAVSDGLMVARGDLGVEMPLEHVPGVQRRLIFAANSCGKPVVVATQMLESMIQAPVPTRAEVSDVSTAVFEGADAIMLSAESASGNYPIHAVTTMSRIAEETERDSLYRNAIDRQRPHPDPTEAGAIAEAARTIATTLNLQAIIAWTSSGATALRLSRERPSAKILALTPQLEVARRLTLVWGIQSLVVDEFHPEFDIVDYACQLAREAAFIAREERAIVVAGIPFGHLGSTNMLRIASAANS